MRIFKLSPFTALIAAPLLLTSACDLDEEQASYDEGTELGNNDQAPSEAEILTYAKDIVVSNEANMVILTIASDNEELLESYSDATFEMSPVFERPMPDEPNQGDNFVRSTIDSTPDFFHSVLIEETSVQLEDGAIGYELRQLGPATRNPVGCASPNIYTSPRDFAWVTIGAGICTEARISTKKHNWSWYAEKGHTPTLCTGQTLDAGKSNTDRVKLEVCPGPGYTYGFYN